ncbi:helix-turn-helix domain-containing protein [Enterococcus thailandicus]|uniref:helix-turn-helix domain-containing protein n=1 Tax=Enterococcus TaxID=1350 RepID=UPI0022E70B69|nr:helix-turn-helix transcriptional regulator [Enterococcus thailandicus]MDA3973257.1 helix-turn-helix transcriptional regulator [Enterococcus thailandicus]MDA3976157.1 helix-turn-helix transcriptional regulator [Enterococcus thailandicus]MDA3980717.1 helix-turn-helix transcriptional regulator [Enterococcus thailandicus]MDT2735447.1 helix-turn-helix transcriptional regulator [Enterococcus thailandicus]MDT2776626.1 helix-turn-helix transcriptional regulator [Enterococcus thailandicus]
MLKQSVIIDESLTEVINKNGETKKEIARNINVSQQSMSDWTSKNGAKPVTLENAQVLSDYFRDSDFTLQIIHEFFGLFKSIDSNVYRRDPSSLDKLQMIESDERMQKKKDVEKILLKQVNYLTNDDRQQIISYAFEFLDEIMVDVTLISALCEILGIDIRKLSEERLSYWVQQGYMKG